MHCLCCIRNLFDHAGSEVTHSRVNINRELCRLLTHDLQHFEEAIPNCVIETGIGTEEEDCRLGGSLDSGEVSILNQVQDEEELRHSVQVVRGVVVKVTQDISSTVTSVYKLVGTDQKTDSLWEVMTFLECIHGRLDIRFVY